MSTRRFVPVTLLAAVLSACGGPSATPTPAPGGGGTAATITITASGATPRSVTVPVGSRVTFANNNTKAHDMNSDPHPEHTDCPEINVGFLAPGQSRATQNLTIARTCGFHDHDDPGNASLTGTIRTQ